MSTPRKKIWTRLLIAILLILALMVALIWSAPAALVYAQFRERLQPIRLHGIEGSLWQGTASQMAYAATPLGPFAWKLTPFSLLSGKAQGELVLTGKQIQAKTDFLATQGQLLLNDAHAEFPASQLAPVLDTPSLALLGNISVDVQQLKIEQGVVTKADGVMQWTELGVSGAAEARLGSIQIDFTTRDDGMIEGRIFDLGGPLRVDGRLEFKDQQFQAEIQLHADENAPQIREALLYIGERTTDGGSLLRIDGTVEKLF